MIGARPVRDTLARRPTRERHLASAKLRLASPVSGVTSAGVTSSTSAPSLDEVVNIELVHLGSIKLGEALPDVLEQRSQLVIQLDDGSHLSSRRLVARSFCSKGLFGHGDERTSTPQWALV